MMTCGRLLALATLLLHVVSPAVLVGPSFTNFQTVMLVDENAPINTTLAVLSATNPNGAVLTFAIRSYAVANILQLTPVSNTVVNITLIQKLSVQVAFSYSILLEVRDTTGYVTQRFATLLVNPVYNYPPTITNLPALVYVNDRTQIGAAVYQVEATSVGNVVTFSLQESSNDVPSGLSISPTNGTVFVTSAPACHNSYFSVTITAASAAGNVSAPLIVGVKCNSLTTLPSTSNLFSSSLSVVTSSATSSKPNSTLVTAVTVLVTTQPVETTQPAVTTSHTPSSHTPTAEAAMSPACDRWTLIAVFVPILSCLVCVIIILLVTCWCCVVKARRESKLQPSSESEWQYETQAASRQISNGAQASNGVRDPPVYANLSYDGDVTASCNSDVSIGTSASASDSRLTPEGHSKVGHVQPLTTADDTTLSPTLRYGSSYITSDVPPNTSADDFDSHVTTRSVPLRPPAADPHASAGSVLSPPRDNAMTSRVTRRGSADGDSMRHDSKHTAGLSADHTDHTPRDASSARDISAPLSDDWAAAYTDNINFYMHDMSGSKPSKLIPPPTASDPNNVVTWLPHRSGNSNTGVEAQHDNARSNARVSTRVSAKQTLSPSVLV